MPERDWYRQAVIDVMPDLMMLAKVRAPNSYVAEDLVQETILRMFELRRDLRASEVKPYAFTVLKNLLVDHYRGENRYQTVADECLDSYDDGDRGDRRFDLGRLIDTLRSMGSECQEVLGLAGLGHTQSEMAKTLEKPIGTVGSLLMRCRIKLVEILGL